MPRNVEQAIELTDVRQSGHFIFASKRHSNTKLVMPRILKHPRQAEVVKQGLLEVLPDDVVVPVPTGALDIAKAWLKDNHNIIPSTKLRSDVFVIYVGHNAVLKSADDITIFEDVVTTGGSAAELGRSVLQINPDAKLHLVGIWRGNELSDTNTELFASQSYLVEKPMPSWPADDCACTDERVINLIA